MIEIRLTRKLNTMWGPIERGAELRVLPHYGQALIDKGYAEAVVPQSEPEPEPDPIDEQETDNG